MTSDDRSGRPASVLPRFLSNEATGRLLLMAAAAAAVLMANSALSEAIGKQSPTPGKAGEVAALAGSLPIPLGTG